MLRPTAVGPHRFGLVYDPLFWQVFIDQSGYSAELRTIIFGFLYQPPTDHWPWEHPRREPNWDLFHFCLVSVTVYRPCVTFLTVDTPSVAFSPASTSDRAD